MIKNVACGMSGGIDSSISAYLLKKHGFNVIGVFMTNWDSKDEHGYCSVEKDREDAIYVCEKLKIPFKDVNFVKDYWNNVFQHTIESYKEGKTPNPDIICNKKIKFDKFAKFCLHNLKVDAFATGHYAKSSFGSFLENKIKYNDYFPILYRPKDKVKDQTFWLSQINPYYLGFCMFPLANLMKEEVKQIGLEIGLNRILQRKESMGMCFIGKRKFSDFIDCYVEEKKGLFKLLDNGKVVGEHNGTHHYTIGQKSRLSFDEKIYYIAQMDTATQNIYVVSNKYHPALFMRTLYTSQPHWLINPPIKTTDQSESIKSSINESYHSLINPPMKTTDHLETSDSSINESHHRLHVQSQNRWKSVLSTVKSHATGGLEIKMDDWFRCIVPGQFAVLYDGVENNMCLGSAEIIRSVTAFEEQVPGPGYWDNSSILNAY